MDDLSNLVHKRKSVCLESLRNLDKILNFAHTVNTETFLFNWKVIDGSDILRLEELVVNEVHSNSPKNSAHQSSNFNYGSLYDQSFITSFFEVLILILVFLKLFVRVDDNFEHFLNWGYNEVGDVCVERLQ